MGQDKTAFGVQHLFERIVRIDHVRVVGPVLQRALEEVVLDRFEEILHALRQPVARDDLLRARVAAGQLDGAVLNVAGPQRQAHRHALHLVLVELPAGPVTFPCVELDGYAGIAKRALHLLGRFEHHRLLVVLAVDRHDHDLRGRQARRQDEPLVVRVRHDQRSDQARRHAPRRRPDVLQLVVLVLERHVERSGEVLPEEVAGAGLERFPVLHQRLDTVRLHGPCEALARRLDAADDRSGHVLLGEGRVDLQHAHRLLDGLLLRRVRGVTLLPEELHRAQEQARTHLPANHVRPLVEQNRQVAPGLDPAAVRIPDDRLARRPDDQVLLQAGVGVRDQPLSVVRHLEPGVRDDGALLGEAFYVLGLASQEGLRDEDGEIRVLVPRLFEHPVEHALHILPERVAVGTDDHAAPDGGVVRELGAPDDVQVPLRIVLLPGRNYVGHCIQRVMIISYNRVKPSLMPWSRYRSASRPGICGRFSRGTTEVVVRIEAL